MRSFFKTPMLLPLLASVAAAQGAPHQQPPVRVNVLNVCSPSSDEQKDISSALSRVPDSPRWAVDFEVSRGRAKQGQSPASDWVRVRRDLAPGSPFTAAQYSFSVDPNGIVETLVLRAKEGGDLVQVVVENEVTSGTPAAVLASDTPASRVRLEMMGKPSRTLTRCPEADQSAYAPLLDRASQILKGYRQQLKVSSTVGAELSRLGVANAGAEASAHSKSSKK